jgi:hypothetical protein
MTRYLPPFVQDGYRLYQTAETMTARLRTCDDARVARRSALRTATQRLAELESDARLDIYLATNGGGKPAYGNESARADAVRKLLRDNPEACRLQTTIDNIEVGLATVDAEYEEQRRLRQNALALLAHATAWLGFAANDDNTKENER